MGKKKSAHTVSNVKALVACVALALMTIGIPAYAKAQNIANDPRYSDIWKKSQILRDRPSLDATPVFFSIAGVKYKVPRNYISHMDSYEGGPQDLVNFKATFPGFEPDREDKTMSHSASSLLA